MDWTILRRSSDNEGSGGTRAAPPLGHVPALTGARGVAIALVLLQHYFRFLSGGFIGVDLFFVLSGFLITTLILEERHATGGVDLRAFYVRRARRLLPALFALLFVVAALAAVPSSPFRGDLPYTAAGLFYVANFVIGFGHQGGMVSGPLGHLWSLAEEEQFYLVWPIALLWLARANARRAVWLLAALVAAISLWRVALVLHGATVERLSFSPDTRADPLLVGCLLGLLRFDHPVPRALRRAAPLIGVAGAAGCAALAAVLSGYNAGTYEYGLPLSELCAAFLIFALVEARSSVISRGLSLRPLVWLGAISYALYVWHPLVHTVVQSPVAASVVAIAVAWLSTRYIERPFRQRRTSTYPAETPAASYMKIASDVIPIARPMVPRTSPASDKLLADT